MTLSRCCRLKRKSLSSQRCGHLLHRIWMWWTIASGVSFNRGSTVRGSMMWRSWKNVCWGSGGCWTTPSSRQRLRSGVAVWTHVGPFRMNGGHFEHKVSTYDVSCSFYYPNVTTLRLGLCCRNSVCPSVCRLSVCNVGAPYSRGWTIRQNFFTAVYAGHPLISVQNFTEIVLGEPLRRGR